MSASDSGLRALDQSLAALMQEIGGQALRDGTQAAAEPVLQAAIAGAPLHTGRLRAALRIVTTSRGASATSSVEVANSGPGGVEHSAVFIEYGTSKEAAHPFMRPAFEATKGAAQRLFEDQINNKLEKFT